MALCFLDHANKGFAYLLENNHASVIVIWTWRQDLGILYHEL